MADERGRGSVLYEVLIVILAVTLIASIMYPKRLTDIEANNTKICRDRLSNIFSAELQYQRYNSIYTDTLSKVIDFLRSDAQYAHYIDSVIVGGIDSIITELGKFKEEQGFIASHFSSTLDTTMLDSLSLLQQNLKMETRRLASFVEYIHDRMKNLPNMPIDELKDAFVIVDSKKFTLDMDIVRNLIESGKLQEAAVANKNVLNTINSVIAQFQNVREGVGQYKDARLDSLRNCPTVHRAYVLVHVDTSTIKYLNVYCPIDSTDMEAIDASFLKSKIGGLEIQNHGKIEKGENSWEAK
ncbi:MAG TPA: hypothetical protein VGA99_11320 [bacterium]